MWEISMEANKSKEAGGEETHKSTHHSNAPEIKLAGNEGVIL
jgi:hypothetical protein